ncbi:MAG: tetratricopeptide repeat protein [Flavobacterium sp.]|uniref:tetratricopeptide repeat protein n=1 Tax=Flavobacterium sp. TaxID=239 RepID=UPI00121FD24B|nr:tetratricopeptide repeat protein [Flavobacterium sp.]RZJ66497.1 MAG: tetratricopeptide repeat protein [Flavobacterium sp.]
MNKPKIFSIAFVALASVTALQAQDVEQAKKAIDAEQYEKAKTMLKAAVQAKPTDGRAAFLLGKVYLKQDIEDSAKVVFQKGITAKDDGNLNYIGLGQLDLNAGNTSAAQSNFTTSLKDIKKKDTEEYIFIARAYMDADKPDYKSALSTLEKAKLANPQDPQVQLALGDAYYGEKNQNDAYVAYRTAVQADPSLIRAKMQQGVLLKGARAFTEAVKAYETVLGANPNYGPVYREMAETYYLWGNAEPKKYTEYIQKALGYYEKYMSLTDYSLASRMRHADFLILAKDYKALEAEAQKMQQLDKVNPRIMRYLGYSAYENGNTDVAIQSLDAFIKNPANKVIARDYMYLGLAKLKKASGNAPAATGTETATAAPVVDATLFNAGVADIKKSVEMESTMTYDLSELGKRFFDQKLFKEAAAIYEIAVTNEQSKNYTQDLFYYGYAIYYANNTKNGKPNPEQVHKAIDAFAKVYGSSPTTQDAYLFKARAHSLLDENTEMAKSYEDYIRVVTEKGAEELAKEATKKKLVEANNNIGAFYIASGDKAKAKEYFNKTLAIQPGETFATEALKQK